MAKTLARTVSIYDEEEGQSVTYKPGDDVPANHAKLITNPKAWAAEDEEEELGPPPGPAQFTVADPKEVEKRATAVQSTEPGAAPGDVAPEKASAEEPKKAAAPTKKSGLGS